MFCLKCGRRLSDDEQFCSQCGTPVTPKLQQPDELNTTDSVVEVAEENQGVILSKTEEEAQPESADTDENSLRLYQEPVPVPAPVPNDVQNPEPAPVYVQAPPAQPQATTQMLSAQQQAAAQTPYSQQEAAQPQYRQAPNQPQYYPAPNDVTAAMRQLPPFMKRKAYFKFNAPEKIRGKVDMLGYLTGMGLGAIVVFLFVFLAGLLDGIYVTNYHGSGFLDIISKDGETILIASIVALAVLAVFALLCILGMKTKHFAFYIFLLLPSICMTAVSVLGFIQFINTNHVKYTLSDSNGFVAILLILCIAVSAIALILSVISLVLSIIVSGSYKKAKQEYMWRAASGNTQ